MKTSLSIPSLLLLAVAVAGCSATDPGIGTQSNSEFDAQTLYEMGYALKHITPVTPELNELTLKALRASADAGNGEAMVQLGEMYLAGRVALDEGQDANQEAVNWWNKAWDHGATRGYHNIGLMYYNVAVPGTGGNGADVYPLDYAEGFRYFKEASDRGDTKAHRFVGHSYENGWGVAQDYSKAAEYYRMNGPVSVQIANLLLDGKGVEQDVDLAIRMYEEVSAKDTGGSADQEAAEKLAHIFEEGVYVEADQDKALKYYQRAADYGSDSAKARLAEFAANLYTQGYAHLTAGDYEEGFAMLMTSANLGNADAIAMTGSAN